MCVKCLPVPLSFNGRHDLAPECQKLLIATYLWLAAAAGLLALSTWLHLVQPYFILTAAFLLGVGFAFGAPVWASIIPEVVPKSELPSAIILIGLQMNLGGIVGPAIGGFLLPIAGPGMLFSLNAFAFLFGAAMIARCYRERRRLQPHLENYLEAFAATARYVRYTPAIQVILARDFLFGLFIAVVPALLPVVAFQHLRLQANQLGLLFTSLGIGSLLGGTLVLPYARAKATPNTLTILASGILVAVFLLMAVVPNVWIFLPIAALAGVSWTGIGIGTLDSGPAGNAGLGSGTNERGAHDGVQGGVALGAILWRGSTTYLGLGKTLVGGAILLSASLALAIPLSINFAHTLKLDPAPLEGLHDFPSVPKLDDGPVTVTMEFIIRPEEWQKFLALIEQVRLIFLRNGAFLFNIDENLENPGTFRTEMLISSWAEHLQQLSRMTKSESEIFHCALAMHVGSEMPIVRHYLRANRSSTPLGFGQYRKTD
jgi:MFS family permease